jgi:hypothetical protein
LEYRPAIVAAGKVHFVQAANDIDHWLDVVLLKRAEDVAADDFWAGATTLADRLAMSSHPESGARFAELPAQFAREKNYRQFRRDLAEHLYRTCVLELCQSELMGQVSRIGESEIAFRRRLEPAISARRESERRKIEQQFATKISRLNDRIQTAEDKVATQKWQFWSRASGFVCVLVDGVMRIKGGRRRSATTAMRGVATERQQQVTAQAALDKLIAERAELEHVRDEQLLNVDAKLDAHSLPLERIELKPRKADIEVDSVTLVWLPWGVDSQGHAEPLYEVSLPPPTMDNASSRAGSPTKLSAAGEALARG